MHLYSLIVQRREYSQVLLFLLQYLFFGFPPFVFFQLLMQVQEILLEGGHDLVLVVQSSLLVDQEDLEEKVLLE